MLAILVNHCFEECINRPVPIKLSPYHRVSSTLKSTFPDLYISISFFQGANFRFSFSVLVCQVHQSAFVGLLCVEPKFQNEAIKEFGLFGLFYLFNRQNNHVPL